MAAIDGARYRAEAYKPALDGLRAVSITLVFFNHLAALQIGWAPEVCGWTGVWVFFVLSGYLIHMLLIREEEASAAADLPAFYVRRVGRIVPAYVVVIMAYAILCLSPLGHGKGPGFLRSLPWFLSFNAELAPDAVAFGQAWTLGIEEKFYIAFPIIAFLVLRRGHTMRRWATLAALGLCVLLNGKYAISYAALLLGTLIADALDRPGPYRRIAALIETPWWVYTLVLASAWTVARFHDALGLPPSVYLGWLALCSAFVIVDVLLVRGARSEALSHPLVRRVGRLSYAFYLVHVIAINLCSPLAKHGVVGMTAAIPAAFALALALAAILHYGVERPGIALAKRLLAGRLRLRRDADDVPAAVDGTASA